MAIAVSDELHEREGPGTNQALTGLWRPCVAVLCQFGELPAKHRASPCYPSKSSRESIALERCLEGFAALDGHKSMPSRESMCPGWPWKADSGAR